MRLKSIFILLISFILFESACFALPSCNQAKDFSLRDQDGNIVSLMGIIKKSKYKLILVSIFQTTCPPCIEEINALTKIRDANKLAGVENFELVLIDSKESRNTTFDFLIKNKISANIVLNDPNGKLDSLYNITSIPMLLAFDRDGAILEIMI